jgi:hypothetical protein
MDLYWIVILVMDNGKGEYVMKLRYLGTFCTCIFSLSISSAVNAAFYDFDQWVNDNGEQAFDNNTDNSDGLNRFELTVDGLRLRAKALNSMNGNPFVYLAELPGGLGGAMGACLTLDTDNLCTVDASVERQSRERLRWDFDENISSVSLQLLNSGGTAFDSETFEYKYNGDSWTDATTNALGGVTLAGFDGSSSRIQFRVKSNDPDQFFYIQSANVSAIPVPAAVWLFASGLLGLVGVNRRRS